jgi:hypothetical protein
MLHKYQMPNLSGVNAQLIGHMNRNCLLKHVTEANTDGRTEVMRRRGRSKQIPGTEERRWYWKLKKESLDLNVWRASFERHYRKTLRKKWTSPEVFLAAGSYKTPKKNVCGFVSGGWPNPVPEVRSFNKFSVYRVKLQLDSLVSSHRTTALCTN